VTGGGQSQHLVDKASVPGRRQAPGSLGGRFAFAR